MGNLHVEWAALEVRELSSRHTVFGGPTEPLEGEKARSVWWATPEIPALRRQGREGWVPFWTEMHHKVSISNKEKRKI